MKRIRFCFLLLIAACMASGQNPASPTRAEKSPGEEVRDSLASGQQPAPQTPAGAPPLPAALTQIPANAKQTITVTEIELRGLTEDIADFKSLPSQRRPKLTIYEVLAETLLQQDTTIGALRELAADITLHDLIAGHYLLAYLAPVYHECTDGQAVFRVSLGRVKSITYSRESGSHDHHSERQIRERLGVMENDAFNYRDIYRSVYQMNTHRHLELDMGIQGSMAENNEDRVVNIALTAKQKLPLHFTLEAGNHGTRDARAARYRTALSLNNLTRHFDSLELGYVTGPDVDRYHGYDGRYARRFDVSNLRLGLEIDARYTRSRLDDLQPQLDAVGGGWDAGIRLNCYAIDLPAKSWRIFLGQRFRDHDNRVALADLQVADVEEESAPIEFGTRYRQYVPDRFQGTTQAGVTFLYHDSSLLASDVFQGDRPRNFQLLDVSLGRQQRLLGPLSFNLKLRHQETDNRLHVNDQFSAGGMGTVRGYPTDIRIADEGTLGRGELVVDLIGAGSQPSWRPRRLGRPSIQAHAFYDAAVLHDVEDNQNTYLRSVGVGIRLISHRRYYIGFDYGIPLADLNGEGFAGRAHIYVQYLLD